MGRATLTARDIADLADVKRPTVAYWRSRPRVRGEQIPFPESVETRSGVEHFDRDAVVEWLRRTGRGNNPEFAVDAAAIALPRGVELASATSLLVLRRLTDRDLARLDRDDLGDLADEVDPDDALILREIEGLDDGIEELTEYVDQLADASLGYTDAYDRLASGRLKRESLPVRFAVEVHELVAGVLTAVAGGFVGESPATVYDASRGRSRLAVSAVRALPEGASAGLVVPGDDEAARQQRRVAVLMGLAATESPGDDSVAVLSAMGLAPGSALDEIDRVQLEISARRLAMVVGPASLLCDAVGDAQLDGVRADILRSDHLRFAARLPRGLWLPAPRMALGLWVFGPAPERRIEDRTIALADLTDTLLTPETIDAVAEDALAAVSDVAGHAFGFGRVMRASSLVAGGAIVPAGVRPITMRSEAPAERVLRVQAMLAELATPMPTPALGWRVDPTHRPNVPGTTIGELVSSGRLRLVSGSRVDRALATDDGTVRLLDPHGADLGFDPLDLTHAHPRATRTEAGDVVFAVVPSPRAVVDEVGGHVVAYPARILRARPGAGVSMRLVATTVNVQAPTAREWRTWRVPLLDPEVGHDLDAVLAALDEEVARLAARSELIRGFGEELVGAVAAGAVNVVPNLDLDEEPSRRVEGA